MVGMQARVGVRIDAAISIDVMLCLQGIYEQLWQELSPDASQEYKRRIADPVKSILLLYCTSFHKFETPKNSANRVI